LARNERPTYVYTYPFKGAYRPLTGTGVAVKSWTSASGRLNIYVHVPYCEMKCSFCNLFTTAQHTAETLRRYCDALLKEIRLVATLMSSEGCEVDSLYFGGGTPTLLPAEQLAAIVTELRRVFRFRPDAELAIESAPNSTDEANLRDLLSVGFQRLSFGIQSFDQHELRAMGRTYQAEVGRRMTAAAVEAGFRNVNIDLIYGLPGQSPQAWSLNLDTAVGVGAQTITVYPLTLRARTRFGQMYQGAAENFPQGGDVYHLYDIAVDFLSAHGYRQYSVAGFANDSGGSRHEVNEFRGVPTLGLGVAALSYSPSLHYTSGDYLENGPTPIIADYVRAVESESLPIRSGIALDDDETRRRHVILGLLYEGIDQRDYETRFGEPIDARFDAEIEALNREGCLDKRGTRLALSRRGRRFSSATASLVASERVKRLAANYR
jgi:oxygen-independent coproporphyrinogen-3 oxidase